MILRAKGDFREVGKGESGKGEMKRKKRKEKIRQEKQATTADNNFRSPKSS